MTNRPSIFSRVKGYLKYVAAISPYFSWSLIKALYAYVWFFYDTASNVEGLMVLLGLVIIIALIPIPGRDDITERQRVVCWLGVGLTLGLLYYFFPPSVGSVTTNLSI